MDIEQNYLKYRKIIHAITNNDVVLIRCIDIRRL
jgi:hypothetical protein